MFELDKLFIAVHTLFEARYFFPSGVGVNIYIKKLNKYFFCLQSSTRHQTRVSKNDAERS